MSVHITFEPEKGNGLVAEGTILLDAAMRMGVQLPAECHGRGECDTCATIVRAGSDLLSRPTEAEFRELGNERLASGERLACQTRVERSGELVVMTVLPNDQKKSTGEAASEFRKEFRDLPLKRKLATLVEFEAVTAFETLTSLASLPFTVGEKILDKVADFGRKMNQQKRELSPSDEKPMHESEDIN